MSRAERQPGAGPPRRWAPLLLAAACAGGCTQAYVRDARVVGLADRGDFGVARQVALDSAISNESDRSFMLDRMKIVHLALADGVPEAAEPIADRLYDFLRTQGVNERNGFGSFVFGESNARVWKGEPFEQAMALASIAVLDGMNGDWGNVRAAANSSLFQIQDLSRSVKRAEGEYDAAQREAVVRAVAEAEAERGGAGDGAAIGRMITPTPSNFALGYVLKAVATRQLEGAFPGEAAEIAAQVAKIAPGLSPLIEQIANGQYNTVLVVDYGTGPEKIRTGPDDAIASFRPTTPSSDDALRVSAGGRTATFPVVNDTNAMARDLRWNNLEDVRVAKSQIGSALLVGGLVVANAGSGDRHGRGRSDTAQAIGLGLALLGAAMKSTAGADTRHVETLPQRTYVALLQLDAPATIELQVDRQPGSRLVLANVPAPAPGRTQLRYVRLPERAAAWATSGRVLYGNDETGPPPPAENFPYILGGRDLRTPNEDVLSSYQRDGHLAGLTLNDLLDLYRAEGILISGRDAGLVGLHFAERGDWLYTPRAGSAGFARLYGTEHPAYQPRSARVREVAAQTAGRASRNERIPGPR